MGERDPASRAPLSIRACARAVARAGRPARAVDRYRTRTWARTPRARRKRQTHVPRPRQAARAVLRLRYADRTRRLRGTHDLLLPGMSDGRPGLEGPPPFAFASLT